MSGLLLVWATAGLFTVSDLPYFAAPPALPTSILYEPAFCLDREFRGTPRPYSLQPGDICFALNKHFFSRLGHFLSGAGVPNHSMIVFAKADGSLAILEAGPQGRFTLEANEAYGHLRTYEDEGSRVWVRSRRTQLSAEQSAALTRFCEAQDGKTFPALRTFAQLTVFRSRAPIRTAWRGKVDIEQRSYFCSELVLNSLVAAGVLDPEPLRPSATYPSDLFFNESNNRFVYRSLKPFKSDWDPPARWVSKVAGN